MIIVKHEKDPVMFNEIKGGEVFHNENNPERFFLRTDFDSWVAFDVAAVDVETGVLYRKDSFVLDKAVYHIVNAEMHIV